MRSELVVGFVFLGLLGDALGVIAQESKGAATPEELLKQLKRAEWDDDLAGRARLSAGPYRSLLLKMQAVWQAGKALDDALEGKFGKGKGVIDKLKPTEKIDRRKVEVKGKKEVAPGRIEITYWESSRLHISETESCEIVAEDTIVCLKGKTGWLAEYRPPAEGDGGRIETRKDKDGKEFELSISTKGKGPSELEAKARAAIFDGTKAIFERTTIRVKAGEYQARKQALEAANKAEQQLLQDLAKKFKPVAKDVKR